MSTETRPLSPRQQRFVLEYLKDGNATQAYLRAGYAPRGAQPSASRLLRDPRIEAAVAAGRDVLAQELEVDVRRLAQEYAKIAFASIDDFVTTGADKRLHIDLEKATRAQRAGIVHVRITNHGKQEQSVSLKLGKLQALAMLVKQLGVLAPKPAPGLTPEDRDRLEDRCAAYQREVDHRKQEQDRLQRELYETRQALEAAKRQTGIENPNPCAFTRARRERDEEVEPAGPPAPPPPPLQQPRTVEPGMPTGPEPDYRPGLYPEAKFVFSGGRQHRLGPDSADALRDAEPGGFDPPGFSEECEENIRALERWIRGDD